MTQPLDGGGPGAAGPDRPRQPRVIASSGRPPGGHRRPDGPATGAPPNPAGVGRRPSGVVYPESLPSPALDDDDPYLYVADEPGLAHKAGAVALFMVLLIVGAVGMSAFWLHSQLSPSDPGEQVTVVIPPDSGLTTISRLLEEQGVVADATVFRYYAKWKDVGTVKAGEYDRLRRHDDMDHVIARLMEGPAPIRYVPVTLPEGLWRSDAVNRIKEKFPEMTEGELTAALDSVHSRYQPAGAPVDGFLFPATYQVAERDRANEELLVKQLVDKFDEVADQLGLGDAPNKLNGVAGSTKITSYDALKVAALIEAEAKVPEDRPRIARVIYNRLKKGEKLGIDASVLYALGQHKSELTKTDLDVDSPYNLRRYPGLTPTPINSPGADSLEAALHPSTEPGADSWFYYVLIDKDGHHFFTGSEQEFLRKQQQARADGLL